MCPRGLLWRLELFPLSSCFAITESVTGKKRSIAGARSRKVAQLYIVKLSCAEAVRAHIRAVSKPGKQKTIDSSPMVVNIAHGVAVKYARCSERCSLRRAFAPRTKWNIHGLISVKFDRVILCGRLVGNFVQNALYENAPAAFAKAVCIEKCQNY